MIRQFAHISSWRKYDITIEPHMVHTVSFIDTLPNIFVINNPNIATLKIGISTIPRTDSYEFRVEYNTTETMGRPIGTNALHILNDSSIPVKINLFSIEKEFDPVLLKNMNVALSGYTLETSSIINGFREGVVLPVRIEEEIKKLLGDIKTTLYDMSGADTLMKNSVQCFNVDGYEFALPYDGRFKIDWLQMIGNEDGKITLNDNDILIIKPNTILQGITLDVKETDVLHITGETNTIFNFRYLYDYEA